LAFAWLLEWLDTPPGDGVRWPGPSQAEGGMVLLGTVAFGLCAYLLFAVCVAYTTARHGPDRLPARLGLTLSWCAVATVILVNLVLFARYGSQTTANGW
jgi:hypothetical protein